jgi:nitrogen-specific signal transduction histidine kinase
LKLREDGPGIPPGLHQDLGRRLISTKGRGRGFGLRAIFEGVKQAGGTSSLDSSGTGTTLTVRLPLA